MIVLGEEVVTGEDVPGDDRGVDAFDSETVAEAAAGDVAGRTN